MIVFLLVSGLMNWRLQTQRMTNVPTLIAKDDVLGCIDLLDFGRTEGAALTKQIQHRATGNSRSECRQRRWSEE